MRETAGIQRMGWPRRATGLSGPPTQVLRTELSAQIRAANGRVLLYRKLKPHFQV